MESLSGRGRYSARRTESSRLLADPLDRQRYGLASVRLHGQHFDHPARLLGLEDHRQGLGLAGVHRKQGDRYPVTLTLDGFDLERLLRPDGHRPLVLLVDLDPTIELDVVRRD